MFTSRILFSFKEIKIKLNGCKSIQFQLKPYCIKENNSAVALWIAPDDNPYHIKPGYKSWGVWTFSLPHLTTYRIEDDKGNILKYRFDVMNKLSIQNDYVSFNDLILDCIIKIDKNNKHIILFEDEQELENEIKNNNLTKEQIHIISSTKQLLQNKSYYVIEIVDNLIKESKHKMKE